MKKLVVLAGPLLLMGSAVASPIQGLGTKPGGSFQAVQPTQIGFMPILQLIVALGIVTFLLKWVLPKVAERLNKSFRQKAGQIVTVEETTPFQGGTLLVVKARGKTLLIGSTGTSVSTLADLTEIPTEVPSPFETQLDAEVGIAVEKSGYAPLDPAEALRRLTQLGGGTQPASSPRGELL